MDSSHRITNHTYEYTTAGWGDRYSQARAQQCYGANSGVQLMQKLIHACGRRKSTMEPDAAWYHLRGLAPGTTDVSPRCHPVKADETLLRLSRVIRLNVL